MSMTQAQRLAMLKRVVKSSIQGHHSTSLHAIDAWKDLYLRRWPAERSLRGVLSRLSVFI